MAQEQLATARITLEYTVSGQTHRFRAFARGLTLVGGTYMINSRTLDENDTDWQDAATRLGFNWVNIAPTGGVVGQAFLDKLEDGVWTSVDSFVPSLSAPSGTFYTASQVTLTLRDKLLNKVRIVALDTNQAAPQRVHFATEGDAHMDDFTSAWVAGTGDVADPFNWAVSKGNQYLKVNPFVSAVVCLNRRVRRKRGVG